MKKTVKFITNIGTNDLKRLGLAEAHVDGAIVSLEETVADRVIRERLAKEHNAASQREDDLQREHDRERDLQAAIQVAEREAAAEAIKVEAHKRVKSGSTKAALPPTPATISTSPHDTK